MKKKKIITLNRRKNSVVLTNIAEDGWGGIDHNVSDKNRNSKDFHPPINKSVARSNEAARAYSVHSS
jgi:hypothetical protein